MNTMSSAPVRRRSVVTPVVVAAVVALAAAAAVLQPWRDSDAAVVAKPVTADARPVAALAAPTGEPVLSVSGVARGNAGAHLTRADFATLDKIAREHVVVYEPFLKRKVEFTGVRFGDLLRRAGGVSGTGRLAFHALDDYTVTLPVGGVASDALLATRSNGATIPVAKGGPIRLIFLDGAKLGASTDNWIWSIDSIRARP